MFLCLPFFNYSSNPVSANYITDILTSVLFLDNFYIYSKCGESSPVRLPSFALSLYVSSFYLFHWFKSLPQRQLALHIPASLWSLLQDNLSVFLVLAKLGKLLGAAVPLGLEGLLFLRDTTPLEFIVDTAALLLHSLNLLLCSGKELCHLLRCFQPLTAQQTGLGDDCVQPLQLQPQRRRERFKRCPALWDSPQQVAVVEIEPIKVALGQNQLHNALVLARHGIFNPPFLPIFLIPELALIVSYTASEAEVLL